MSLYSVEICHIIEEIFKIGGNLEVNKRGRPPRDDEEVKNKQYRLRLSYGEESILDELSTEYGMPKAEILRRGLRIQHNLLSTYWTN